MLVLLFWVVFFNIGYYLIREVLKKLLLYNFMGFNRVGWLVGKLFRRVDKVIVKYDFIYFIYILFFERVFEYFSRWWL